MKKRDAPAARGRVYRRRANEAGRKRGEGRRGESDPGLRPQRGPAGRGPHGRRAAAPLPSAPLGFLAGPSATEFRTDQFEGYYNALLHRPDDAGGVAGWVFSNLDRAAVRIEFEASPEFFTNG